ncbi:MAG TPA: O-antigen ligase family protein [Vicinamibacteria bacterium]|nr:O-antigen ligase family protein [Vicinamibacteria bacterium]
MSDRRLVDRRFVARRADDRPPLLRRLEALDLQRAQVGLTAAVAATCLVSIFAAQVLLAVAAVVYLARLFRRQTFLERLPLDGPILAFSVWTLLSAAFSPDPLLSHASAKKLVLFALLYLSVDSLRDARARERILEAALLGGVVLAAGAVLQYHFLGFDTVNNRPRSFLGHYMTASGLVMAVMVLAAARLCFGGRPASPPSRHDLRVLALVSGALALLSALQAAELFALEGERLFVAGLAATAVTMATSRGPWPGAATGATLATLAIPLCAWALVLSRTRNAWLGALVGLVIVAVMRTPRLLWLFPTAAAVILVARPAPVMDRLTVTDASSRDRYFMWQAGIDMIREKPVFGQGPRMVERTYPSYRWPGAPNAAQPHLHNNALQIAAERGLPCLVWWLWWVAAAMGDAWRESRRGKDPARWGAVGALAVLSAVMAAGLFEYNFGDSEILMFTLIVTALPYALRPAARVSAADAT